MSELDKSNSIGRDGLAAIGAKEFIESKKIDFEGSHLSSAGDRRSAVERADQLLASAYAKLASVDNEKAKQLVDAQKALLGDQPQLQASVRLDEVKLGKIREAQEAQAESVRQRESSVVGRTTYIPSPQLSAGAAGSVNVPAVEKDTSVKPDSLAVFKDAIKSGKAEQGFNQPANATGILTRSSLYHDVLVESKSAQLEGIVDQKERLSIINAPGKQAVSPAVARVWSALDANEFRRIADLKEKEIAAAEIVNNSKLSKTYKNHLEKNEPELFAQVKQLNDVEQKVGTQGPQRSFAGANDLEQTEDDLTSPKARADRGRQIKVSNATLASISQIQSQPANEEVILNTIERSRERDRGASDPVQGNKVVDDDLFSEFSKKSDSKKVPVQDVVPAEIDRDYIRVGDKFHFAKRPDLEAFRDKGDKLETKSSSEKVAADLVRIAVSRDWEDIKVSGTPEFRRNVWVAGKMQGLEVKGYEPTEADQALLISKQRGVGLNTPAPERKTTSFAGKNVGELVEHGSAPYGFKDANSASYYAKLKDQNGKERVYWGSDIERAIKASGAKEGDVISLDRDGKSTVSFDDKKFERTTWLVRFPERQADADLKADIVLKGDVKAAAKDDPNLFNAAAQLRVAELISNKIPNESDRDKFMQLTREALAKDIADQKKLSPVVIFNKEKEQVQAKDKELSR